MEDWKKQNPVEWDAATKEAGGAECTGVASDVGVRTM